MSDELKPCPFCGNNKNIDGEWSLPDEDGNQYYTTTCPMCNAQTTGWYEWNERPLEDALLTRAEHAETDAVCLRHENEVLKATVERLIDAGNWLALHYEVARTQQGFCLPSLRIKIWHALAAEGKEGQK